MLLRIFRFQEADVLSSRVHTSSRKPVSVGSILLSVFGGLEGEERMKYSRENCGESRRSLACVQKSREGTINTFQTVSPCGPTHRYSLAGVDPGGLTYRHSFDWCRSRGTDTCNIYLAGVGHFSGHFVH